MSAAKQLFQRKEEGKASLAGWWSSIVNDPRFEMVKACARAEVMEYRPPQAHVEGAELMLGTLQGLAESEVVPAAYPTPGLQHRFTPPKPDTSDKPN